MVRGLGVGAELCEVLLSLVSGFESVPPESPWPDSMAESDVAKNS